jgi:hypothetical protein
MRAAAQAMADEMGQWLQRALLAVLSTKCRAFYYAAR